MWRVLAVSAIACLMFSKPVQAAVPGVDAIPFQGVKVKIDGVLSEWRGTRTTLGALVSGEPKERDPDVYALVGFDREHLYFAFKVKDANLYRTKAAGPSEDHAEVVVAFPKPSGGYGRVELLLYPGKPGRLPGVVKLGGRVLKGASLVEAPMAGGYKIEAKVPWSAFADARRVRVGLRIGLSFVDADAGGAGPVVVASSSASELGALPWLRLESERALAESLLGKEGLPDKPARAVYGNVAGDDMFEQVAIFGTFLAIVGPRYRRGTEFYYADLGIPWAKSVQHLSLVDFDGDGRDEIVLQKRVGGSERYREVLQVLTVEADGTPSPMFQHEVAIKTPSGLIQNKVSVQRKQGAPAIEIAQGKVTGIDPDDYREPLSGDMPSALLPWDRVKSRTFKWRDEALGMWSEQRWKPKMAPPKPKLAEPTGPSSIPKGAPGRARAKAPAPPREPTPEERLEKVYALYRRDRGVVKRKPRFDFVADIAESEAPERVLVHGKDIVAFGKGFLNGESYSMISIGVDDAKDIKDVGARDVTGDGKAEIIVRAVLHAKASRALGGHVVDRHAVFVYTVDSGRLSRLFGAEVMRQLGKDKIVGDIAFFSRKGAHYIELRPGRADGWTEQSYPFPRDTSAAGGLEPLLLPWGDQSPRRYRFSGGRFGLE